MATALDLRHRTLADFLAWEEQQPERYERVGGVIRMMTGGTVAHNRITRNCARTRKLPRALGLRGLHQRYQGRGRKRGCHVSRCCGCLWRDRRQGNPH